MTKRTWQKRPERSRDAARKGESGVNRKLKPIQLAMLRAAASGDGHMSPSEAVRIVRVHKPDDRWPKMTASRVCRQLVGHGLLASKDAHMATRGGRWITVSRYPHTYSPTIAGKELLQAIRKAKKKAKKKKVITTATFSEKSDNKRHPWARRLLSERAENRAVAGG
jgi:hypothetical protein